MALLGEEVVEEQLNWMCIPEAVGFAEKFGRDDTGGIPSVSENKRYLNILKGRAPSRPQRETFLTEPAIH